MDLDVPSIGELNFDSFLASAAHAEPPKGVSAKQLSKVWQIDLETAEQTLNVTSQHCKRNEDHSYSRNFSTNDRMFLTGK